MSPILSIPSSNEITERHIPCPNYESRRRASKKWRSLNPELNRTRNKSYVKPLKELIRKAKRRAIERNLEFDICEGDLTIPSHCPVLGIPLKKSEGFSSDGSPSLDRIYPNKGYTKDNVRIISWKANRMKSDMDIEICRLILRDLENCQTLPVL